MRSLVLLLLLLSPTLLFAADEIAASNPLEAAKREFQQGHFDAAMAALQESEKRGDPPARVLDMKGCVYAEQQKYEEAISAFEASSKLEPGNLARMHLADVLLRQKKWSEARETYEAVMKGTNVLMANERLRYGVLLTALGAKDDEAARIAFEKLPFPSESSAYYYAQAAWAFAHGAKSDGDKWIRRAEDIFQPKGTAWFARPLFDLGWIKTKPPLIAD